MEDAILRLRESFSPVLAKGNFQMGWFLGFVFSPQFFGTEMNVARSKQKMKSKRKNNCPLRLTSSFAIVHLIDLDESHWKKTWMEKFSQPTSFESVFSIQFARMGSCCSLGSRRDQVAPHLDANDSTRNTNVDSLGDGIYSDHLLNTAASSSAREEGNREFASRGASFPVHYCLLCRTVFIQKSFVCACVCVSHRRNPFYFVRRDRDTVPSGFLVPCSFRSPLSFLFFFNLSGIILLLRIDILFVCLCV